MKVKVTWVESVVRSIEMAVPDTADEQFVRDEFEFVKHEPGDAPVELVTSSTMITNIAYLECGE